MRRCPQRGVLPGQPPDQLADLLRDGRAPGSTRIGPLVLDQAPVSGEQGTGRHDPVQALVPGQQPCQSGDHGPISPVQCWAGDLTAQDRDLMPHSRIMSRYRRRKSTNAEDRSPGQMLCTSFGTPHSKPSRSSSPCLHSATSFHAAPHRIADWQTEQQGTNASVQRTSGSLPANAA